MNNPDNHTLSFEIVQKLLDEISPGSRPIAIRLAPGSYSNFTHSVTARDSNRAEICLVVRRYQPELQLPSYPLLLALQGANATAEAEHWMASVSHGWFLGLPQSSEVYSPGVYTWNDWDWALQEGPQRYATICAENPIDIGRVVLAGFFIGGGVGAPR